MRTPSCISMAALFGSDRLGLRDRLALLDLLGMLGMLGMGLLPLSACGGTGGRSDDDTTSTAGPTTTGDALASGSSAEGGPSDGTGTTQGPGTGASDDPSAEGTTLAPETTGDPPPGSCGDPPVWCPTPGTRWQWQLSGVLDTTVDVDMMDIDLFDTDPRQISGLQATRGHVVVCYFSAGSHEDWRPDAGEFPPAAIGDPLDGWPGERWLDVRDDGVRAVLAARLDLAVEKGCDGVEPDNVDGYANATGFPLTADDQLDFNRWLSDAAHERGLSVGLKNDLEQVEELLPHFDWALNEECMAYDECDLLAPFIDAGKAVFHVEYVDDPAQGPELAAQVCPDALARSFSTLIKGWDLDAWRIVCE
jgi:endo-alpha-1,4-polygalactosaminidase (GH114 family)